MKNIRWYLFWLFDFVKGGKVRYYYKVAKESYEKGTKYEDTQRRIVALINHAVSTTEFYKRFDSDTSISDLPVMNKSIYKEKYDQFISSIFLNAKSNRIKHTSGSTGIPFAMIQDKRKIIHNIGASIFLCTLGDYYIGMKTAYMGIWDGTKRENKFQSFIENRFKLDTRNLDEKGMDELLDVVKRKRINVLFGFASSFSELSKYIKKNPFKLKKIKIESIISRAEMLPEYMRKNLREKFSCSVSSTYSSEENGIMGIQDTGNSYYYIDSFSYYFEVLKLDRDEPVEPGELGRLVITDLFNYAFPIIRYDNGDLAVIEKNVHNNRYKVYIKELFGRKTDLIFKCNGNPISPHALSMSVRDVDGIRQFQFVQVGEKDYNLIINLDDSPFNDMMVTERLLNLLRDEAKVEITFVNEIPVLNSGKRRYIVNEYRK